MADRASRAQNIPSSPNHSSPDLINCPTKGICASGWPNSPFGVSEIEVWCVFYLAGCMLTTGRCELAQAEDNKRPALGRLGRSETYPTSGSRTLIGVALLTLWAFLTGKLA